MGTSEQAPKELHNYEEKAGMSADLMYEHNEQQKLLVRSRRQLWVWRIVSYIIIATLIGVPILLFWLSSKQKPWLVGSTCGAC